MATIGSFKKVGSEFQGEIVTLSVQAMHVRIVPEADRSNGNAPSHRVFVGRAEIGIAWSSLLCPRSRWKQQLIGRGVGVEAAGVDAVECCTGLGAKLETTVDQALIRGLGTAFRVFVSGLSSV